ncbi:MAG TPA: chromate efflux transporter [Myxococcaceae bacterium]|nr:chromate efflux transporter [Myxococcaceae bacterium]
MPAGEVKRGDPDGPDRTSLRELALLFLRLGTIAFGGPAAHIAMMEDEVVRRRKWLSGEQFLDLLGATNLIPGPNSTEMAIHVGRERRGVPGLVVAGASFILPAMLMTGALGWVYLRFGSVPTAAWLLYGVKPVILAVVLQAIWNLVPKAARTMRLRGLAVLSVIAAALGVNELAVLFGAGAAAMIAARVAQPARPGARGGAPPLVALAPVIAGSAAASAVTLPRLFWVFLKTGAVLFGSGYVLLAFLRADLVERLGWLTEAQLIDAIAVGQVTPGPVFTTATFIGYVLAGPSGALVATAGIFLPAFAFVAVSGPLIPRLRASRLAGAFLDGVNVASLALMALVTFQLGRTALIDAPTVGLAAVAALLLVRFKPNATWLVLGGAGIGWAVHALGLAG